jgi:hypothetical protein
MPFICYTPKRFHPKSEKLIAAAQELLCKYADAGINLTLRQLYFQLIDRRYLENSEIEFNRFKSTINSARLAGRIDWDSMKKSAPFISDADRLFHDGKWFEVWGDNSALLENLASVFPRVPFVLCPSFAPSGQLWVAAQLRNCLKYPMQILTLYPPKVSADLQNRLRLFEAEKVTVESLSRVDVETIEPSALVELIKEKLS